MDEFLFNSILKREKYMTIKGNLQKIIKNIWKLLTFIDNLSIKMLYLRKLGRKDYYNGKTNGWWNFNKYSRIFSN